MSFDIKEYDDWLDRHLDGSLTKEDWVQIDKKIKQDPEFAKNFALDLVILRGANANNTPPVTIETTNTAFENPFLKPSTIEKKPLMRRWETRAGIVAICAFLFFAWRILTTIGNQKVQIAKANAERDSLKIEADNSKKAIDSLNLEKNKQGKEDGNSQPPDIVVYPTKLPLFKLDWEKRKDLLNKFKLEEAGWKLSAGSDNLKDWQFLFFKKPDNGKTLLAVRKILNEKPKIDKDQDADLCFYGGVLNLYVSPDTGNVEEAVKWLRIVKDTFPDKKYAPFPYFIEALSRSSNPKNRQEAKAFLKKNTTIRDKLPEDIQQYLDAL